MEQHNFHFSGPNTTTIKGSDAFQRIYALLSSTSLVAAIDDQVPRRSGPSKVM